MTVSGQPTQVHRCWSGILVTDSQEAHLVFPRKEAQPWIRISYPVSTLFNSGLFSR